MNRIAALIKDIESKGIQLKPLDDSVWLSKENLTAEVIKQVKTNKPEILYFLRSREYNQLRTQAEKLGACLDDTAAPLPAREEKLSEYESLTEQIADLQGWTDYYEQSGLSRWYSEGWVLIFSNLLNEMIVLIRSAEVKLPESARVYPAYFFEEVQLLDGKDDQTIRAAHSVKKTFNGQVAKGAKK